MAGYGYDPHAWPSEGVGDRQSATAPDLNEAVKELRRFTDGGLLQALKRLADMDEVHEASRITDVLTVQLCGAEHLRIATELEAAARYCRLIEQGLRQQIDAAPAGSPGQAGTAGDQNGDGPLRRTRRRGLVGLLRLTSQHARSRQEPVDRDSIDASPVPGSRPLTSSVEPCDLRNELEPRADAAVLVLGPLELDADGRRVTRWNSFKARAVFQYLLIHHGRPVRREALMALQWPDHTRTSARNNLNVALHSLRNTLGGPWRGLQPIVYRDGCYALNPELEWWIDRDEFLSALNQAHLIRISGQLRKAICSYERAIQLYRGPLFEDDLSGDWYLPEQRHLNELYLEALESLGEIYFDLGELAAAESFGRLALTSDPCCEPVHRLLMRCYAFEHKQQLVTRQYRLCVDALRDELGVSPGAETLRLFRDLTSAGPLSRPHPRSRAPATGRYPWRWGEIGQTVGGTSGEM